ncbi:anaphase-promoting complex subunit 5-like isoform X2 [Lineus longissimus]|uniref:anaphase-promoting complex subunit 5-like isoform X2 n=1 Tax=Lineus longissimus TaxID=88925 RepID=UPI002B4F3A51
MTTDLFSFGVGKNLMEHVTPHKMALLVMIREYCIVRGKMKGRHFLVNQEPEVDDIKLSEKEMRDFMTTMLKLLQSGDTELKQLCYTMKKTVNTELYTLFVDRFEEMYSEGIRKIMDFFQFLSDVLLQEPNTLVNKSSVVGLFIRRMVLSFETLSFSQVTKIYHQYRRYYEEWNKTCPPPDDADSTVEQDSIVMDLTNELDDSDIQMDKLSPQKRLSVKFEDTDFSQTGESGTHSRRQAEYFLSQQAHLLQHNEEETLPTRRLQEKLGDLLRSNPELAEVHYLSYLNNLRVNEFCGAVHSIYHYFDRLTLTTPAGKESVNKKQEDDSVKGYRYAILNLAALHFKFGHREESLAALHEAISIAQEYNDNVCLQHALGWLHRLGEQNTLNTANLLERAVTKSNELHLPYLTSLGIQALAKHSAANCVPPASVFEFILKSDILNCQHSQLDLMSISYAQKSAMWHMYGNRLMSTLSSQLLLNLNTAESGIYLNGEAGCIALCNLARVHIDEGHTSIAMEILESCKRRFPNPSQHAKIWMLAEQTMLFETAMHHGKWSQAEQAILNMAAVNNIEAKYRKAILLKEKGETSKALSLLNEVMEGQSKDPDDTTPDLFARVTLMYAELYCQTGNMVVAISPLLSCVTFCRRHYFSYLAAMATMYLAYVQFCMNLPNQALKLIEQELVTILTYGTQYDKARVLYLYAKCQVASVSHLDEDTRKPVLTSITSQLNKVIDLFKGVEDFRRMKDVYYYQARLYHELGQGAERNKCALEFRQLDQLYPTLTHLTVNVL